MLLMVEKRSHALTNEIGPSGLDNFVGTMICPG